MHDHGEQHDSNTCVFCAIAADTAPAYIIEQDDLSIALLDINPLARGHCLVIPRRHVSWWHEMTRDETTSLYDIARRVARKLMSAFQPDFICQYARGRRIPHAHIFLVPTFSGDLLDRFFNTIELVQEEPHLLTTLKKPDALKETAEILRGVNLDKFDGVKGSGLAF